MFGLFNGKKKKEFMSDSTKAYFHIYCGKKITIDGQNFSEFEHIKGDDLEDVAKVSPDAHVVTANYELPANSVLNSRIKAKSISITCPPVEAGKHYVISIFEVTPEAAAAEENTLMDFIHAEELEKGYSICLYRKK